MATDYTICIGTVGQGLWQSPDGGESWVRMRTPFPLESRVRALTRHPTEPHTLFAGADSGLYLSRDNGAAWAHVSAPEPRLNIWSLAVVPTDPETLFAGTSPSAVYRSRDGGHQWEPLALELAEECAIGTPRVTATVVDPDDPRLVWAGVEIDGVHRSLDGGDTWTRVAGGLSDPDIHGMVIAPGDPSCVLTSTPREIFASTDVGESWQPMQIAEHFPAPYCRWIAMKPDDPQVIFAACGDSAIGSSGNLQKFQHILEANGASLSNVVKVTSFVTDLREALASAEVRRTYFAGAFPASTQVQVAALGTPDLKIEIEAIAVLPD